MSILETLAIYPRAPVKSWLVRFASLTATCYFFAATFAVGAESLIKNGDFSEWTEGRPDHWQVSIGATNGADEPKSSIDRLAERGLVLKGDRSTLAWHSLTQPLALEGGKPYKLEFEARSLKVRRERRQFNNCFVGVMSFGRDGKRVSMSIKDLSQVAQWKQHELSFSVPRNAARTDLMVFLSKSGSLQVRNVTVVEVLAGRPFDVLLNGLRQHYSFSALKEIDWDTLAARYRDRAQRAASAGSFVDVIREMLAELEDPHVWIVRPDGEKVYPFMTHPAPNYDYQVVRARLRDASSFRDWLWWDVPPAALVSSW